MQLQDDKKIVEEEPSKPINVPNIIIISNYKSCNALEEESSPTNRKGL